MEIGLVRRCPSELVAAALLGLIRGVIELMVRQTDATRRAPDVDDVVSEMLQVALRGVLA
jgi:hypothetical protein